MLRLSLLKVEQIDRLTFSSQKHLHIQFQVLDFFYTNNISNSSRINGTNIVSRDSTKYSLFSLFITITRRQIALRLMKVTLFNRTILNTDISNSWNTLPPLFITTLPFWQIIMFRLVMIEFAWASNQHNTSRPNNN